MEELALLEGLALSRMERIVVEGPFETSTQGANITYFYESNLLRAVNAIIAGETGKSEVDYKILSSTDYVVNYVNIEYSGFIYEPDISISSKSTYKFYVCGGQLIKEFSPNAEDSHLYYDELKDLLHRLVKLAPK